MNEISGPKNSKAPKGLFKVEAGGQQTGTEECADQTDVMLRSGYS